MASIVDISTNIPRPIDLGSQIAAGYLNNIGKARQNSYQSLVNEMASKTMAGKIAAMNAQNQGVSETAIPLDKANLNLSLARANALANPPQKVTPYTTFNNVYSSYQKASNPQLKQAYGQMLNKLVSGTQGTKVSSTPTGGVTVTTGGQGGQYQPIFGNNAQQPTGDTAILKSPSRGTQRTYIKNSDGTYSVNSMPTTTTLSNTQKRQQAESESRGLMSFIDNSMAPYQQKILGGLNFSKDINSNDPKKYEQAVKFMTAHRLITEALANQGRLAGLGNIGADALKQLETRYPNVPSQYWENLAPLKARLAANNNATTLNYLAADKAINQASGDFPQTINEIDAPIQVKQALNNLRNNKGFVRLIAPDGTVGKVKSGTEKKYLDVGYKLG